MSKKEDPVKQCSEVINLVHKHVIPTWEPLSDVELVSNPTVRLSDIKARSFHICDTVNPCSKCLAAGESDEGTI